MRHVLITGTSSGIGYHLTETFLNAGFIVWSGARMPQALQPLLEKFPHSLHVLQLDVTSKKDIDHAWRRISTDASVEKFFLINNAGIVTGGPIEALPMEDCRHLFDVNVFGLIEITQRFLPLLRRTRGRIVNMGSLSGRVAAPFLGPYCASKFAVRAVSDSLRREVSDLGVHVALIEAGPIDTPIWEKAITKASEMKNNLSPEMNLIYGDSMKALAAGLEVSSMTAFPMDYVGEAAFKALTARKPKAYYYIGKNIRRSEILVKYLPVRLLDRIIVKGFHFRKSHQLEDGDVSH